jgi:hypothetical protein
MGFSYHKTKDDYFITINGKPFTDFDPADVRDLINSLPEDERELIHTLIKDKQVSMYEEMTGRELPEDYAKEHGRPPLSEVPFMSSENDGYPYIPGHSPLCDGKPYHNGMCQCQYDEWNMPGGEVNPLHTEMWPGGPCIDDFDM